MPNYIVTNNRNGKRIGKYEAADEASAICAALAESEGSEYGYGPSDLAATEFLKLSGGMRTIPMREGERICRHCEMTYDVHHGNNCGDGSGRTFEME